MKVIAVSGFKDSGKTTLCRALVGELSRRGLSVGYIKRTQERVFSDPGTDSGSIAALGVPALLWGEDGLRLESPCGNDSEDTYKIAGKFFPDADIVILEGGKNLPLPKIWVARPGEQVPPVPGIFAVYDRHGPGDGDKRYGRCDLGALVCDIASRADFAESVARVYVGDMELPMKGFVADFVAGGVKGMLGSLKKPGGMDEAGDVRVYIRSARAGHGKTKGEEE
jgi:molybdopterin-guanine dinucleotide biosynthesis protein B